MEYRQKKVHCCQWTDGPDERLKHAKFSEMFRDNNWIPVEIRVISAPGDQGGLRPAVGAVGAQGAGAPLRPLPAVVAHPVAHVVAERAVIAALRRRQPPSVVPHAQDGLRRGWEESRRRPRERLRRASAPCGRCGLPPGVVPPRGVGGAVVASLLPLVRRAGARREGPSFLSPWFYP